MVDGFLLIDKPPGLTSHDVVARCRRILGTRKVGHAGTLDPMATGLLVLGAGRATRLLGHLAATDKEYLATIRLGRSTLTDDAEGEPLVDRSAAEVSEEQVRRGVQALTGPLDQVPSQVSAVKVDGQRSYRRVRAGEEVDLPARPVTVHAFEVLGLSRPSPEVLDVDVVVRCSSGTYVRALARDLGAALEVGGHLTRLRRTRVGPFAVADAVTLEQLAAEPRPLPIGEVLATAFALRRVDADSAVLVRHGRPLPLAGETGPTAVVGPEGEPLALMAPRDGALRVVVGLAG